MARSLGIECKKQEVYLAVVENDRLLAAEPQRLEVSATQNESARLRGFVDSMSRVLAELQPDIVRILQPESTYTASYTELEPKIALMTLIRLACVDANIPVEVLHRATARKRVGFPRGGNMGALIDESIEQVGEYWAAGRKYAAVAALAEEG